MPCTNLRMRRPSQGEGLTHLQIDPLQCLIWGFSHSRCLIQVLLESTNTGMLTNYRFYLCIMYLHKAAVGKHSFISKSGFSLELYSPLFQFSYTCSPVSILENCKDSTDCFFRSYLFKLTPWILEYSLEPQELSLLPKEGSRSGFSFLFAPHNISSSQPFYPPTSPPFLLPSPPSFPVHKSWFSLLPALASHIFHTS